MRECRPTRSRDQPCFQVFETQNFKVQTTVCYLQMYLYLGFFCLNKVFQVYFFLYSKCILKFFNFFFQISFFMILDHFNVLMSKINFKIKINYFDVFQNKKYFKKQQLPQFQTLF